jgi:heme exporter protein C
MNLGKLSKGGMGLALFGVIVALVFHWQIFFWVPTEQTMGIVQRIFYIHVPSAWVAFLAFAIVAICSAGYLWLRDDRLDRAALSAAEGGMLFTTLVLLTGPLWAKIAWGTWWEWEPRLTFTLLLWFIYLGYFLVRRSTENPERGKRFAAVVGIVGALDIPLIHISVKWFRSLHPEAVVLKPEGPSLHPDMLTTLLTAFAALLLIFFALFLFRYALEGIRETLVQRELDGDNAVRPEGATS